MWSDLSQSLKGSISCLYLKFVPEGLNHNEDLFLSQSQIYYTQCGYCRVLSKDMSCQSNTKQPEDLLSGGGSSECDSLCQNTSARAVRGLIKMRFGGGDKYPTNTVALIS